MLPSVVRVAALPVLALLVSCTGPTAETKSPAPSPAPSSASPTTTSTAAKNRTAQGFLPKKLGEVAGLDCTSGLDSCPLKFTVDKIEVNPKCHQYGTPAAAGRKTLLLHVSLTTGDLDASLTALAPMLFNPFSLKGLSADGFVHDAQPGSCTNFDGRLSNTILPNSKYTGTVEVEVPESAASIASAQQLDPNSARGWVWNIGCAERAPSGVAHRSGGPAPPPPPARGGGWEPGGARRGPGGGAPPARRPLVSHTSLTSVVRSGATEGMFCNSVTQNDACRKRAQCPPFHD